MIEAVDKKINAKRSFFITHLLTLKTNTNRFQINI